MKPIPAAIFDKEHDVTGQRSVPCPSIGLMVDGEPSPGLFHNYQVRDE